MSVIKELHWVSPEDVVRRVAILAGPAKPTDAPDFIALCICDFVGVLVAALNSVIAWDDRGSPQGELRQILPAIDDCLRRADRWLTAVLEADPILEEEPALLAELGMGTGAQYRRNVIEWASCAIAWLTNNSNTMRFKDVWFVQKDAWLKYVADQEALGDRLSASWDAIQYKKP